MGLPDRRAHASKCCSCVLLCSRDKTTHIPVTLVPASTKPGLLDTGGSPFECLETFCKKKFSSWQMAAA